MRNFYVFVLMLLIGAWANVTQVAAQDAAPADGMTCHIKYGDLYLTLNGEGTGDDADRKLVLTAAASDKSLWQLKKNGTEDNGSFIVKNMYCGFSLGIQQQSLALVTGDSRECAYTFAVDASNAGHYSVYSEESVNWGDAQGNFYMSGSGLSAGADVVGSTTADAGWTLMEQQVVTKAVRVTALDQLITGSKIVIRNAGGSDRDGYVHESDGKLLINHGASSFQNLTDDYVFTLADYSTTDGTCYLTAKSGNKISGTGAPMTTVAEPEGKITLVVENPDRWDLKYGDSNWFNTQTNDTDGPFVNTWTAQGDTNASWEIYMVVDDAVFMPEEGQAYYIDCLKSGNGRAVYLPGMNILGISGDSDALHWGNLFTISTVLSSGEVRYQIKSYANPDAYVYYVNTNSADENVGITTNASHANLNWKITKSTATDVDGYNIIPSTGSNGWNCRGSVSSPWWGSKTAIGQWNDNTKADNTWGFVAVNETGVTAAVQTYKTTIQPPCGTVGCCTQEEYTNAYNQLTEQKDLFMAPWSIPSQSTMIKPSNASGLYKIKNKQLNKYLFQNDEQKNIAFINDGGDNTKYYYRVTFDGNQATIINSNAKPLARGNQGATYANATTVVASPVTLTYCGGNGYFLFPNTHSTAQNNFTQNYAAYNTDTNPYFLTTWTSVEAANQYTFEEVTIPEGSYVYDVQFEGLKGLSGDDALTVTYTGADYEGNTRVGNGGFYVFSTTPQVSDFEASDDENYGSGTVTIDEENHLVKVSFAAKKAILTLQVTMDGVKYHEASMEAKLDEAYSDLLGNYKWLLSTNATLTVNGVEKAISDVFTDGSIIPTEDATYTFALKMTDILKEGQLYQISSAVTTTLNSGRGGKKIYGKPEMIYTKAVGDDLNTEPFSAMAHSLWKFVYTDTEQGYFKIYNQVTGKYMGPVANPVVFTDETAAGVYKLIPASKSHQNGTTVDGHNVSDVAYTGALFKIAAYDAKVSDGNKLHIQNTGNNQLIAYDSEEIWSKWYFTASNASIAKVESVKDIESRLLVQGRVTPSTKADMTGMTITKEDGTDVTTVLTDDDAATSASGSLNSYLQVDLGSIDVRAFAFYTKRYGSNNNNRPTEIEVQASTDGTDYATLYTFYGIPVANEDFYSPSYLLDGQQYLRFVVKATYSASSTFDFSEFHIQTTTGVLPSKLAAASLTAGKTAIDAVCQPYNAETNYDEISDALRDARDNALAYAAAHKALKDRIADLTPFIDRTDLVEGDEVHQFTIAKTATAAEDWKAALTEINGYVDDVNNPNINTKVGCETVLATLPAITFNTPKDGEVYLLKSAYNSKYAATPTKDVSGAKSSSLDAMADGYTNETAFMLQYTEDGKLISVVDGTELILRNLNTYTFSEHPRYPNTYLVASPDRYMYAGDDALNFNGFGEAGYAAQQTSWKLEHVKTYPVTAREVSEGKNWATFYTNEAVYLPNGMKARYVDKGVANPTETEDGSKVYQLTYTEIKDEKNILPANTGVLLVTENSGEHKLYASRCASSVETPANNALVGMATEDDPTIKEDGVTLYALGKPAGYDAGFYRYTGSTIPLNKAFLKMDFSTGSTSAFGFIFVDGDDATGIEAIQPAAVGEEDGVCYDLTGKRVVNPTRPGIYIKNGKKLVIK